MNNRYTSKGRFTTTNKGYTGIIKGNRVGSGNKEYRLTDFDENIDDRDIVDFCLNCAKPNCEHGTCVEIREYMKKRKNSNG